MDVSGTVKTDAAAKPSWIKGRVLFGEAYAEVKGTLKDLRLSSVCVEAACPNRGECWEKKHVTFMILGEICTRGCLFCGVSKGKPLSPDRGEGERIANAVERLAIKYAVITSVTRDDLEDRGSGEFIDTVRAVKKISPDTIVEILIPDFSARGALLERIACSGADVISHNIEMPERLYKEIRPASDYRNSIDVLGSLAGFKSAENDFVLKSSIIVGLGETSDDIARTMYDIRSQGADILYIGQYLSPDKCNWPVRKYYTPEEFGSLRGKALGMGFGAVQAGPMVRSSYRALEAYRMLGKGKRT